MSWKDIFANNCCCITNITLICSMTPAVVEVGWTSTRPRTLVGCAIPNLVWILLYLSLTGVPYYSIQGLTMSSNFKNSFKPDLFLLLRFHHGQGTLGNEKSYWRTVGGKTTRFLVPFQMFNKQKCPSFWRYLSNEKSYWIMMMCVTPRYSVMRGSHSLGTRRAQRMKSRRPQGPPTRSWGAEGPQTSCV